jgi:hypothetical protein
MPSFITWSIQSIKGVFSAIAGVFTRFFDLFRKKPRKYTYSVSNDDITSVLAKSHPKGYISDIVQSLKIVDPDNDIFEGDLNRFTSVVFDSTQIFPAYDLTNLEGRNALVNDKLLEYGLTMDQMKPALSFLTQRLPQYVVMVLYGTFPGRHFLADNGESKFKVSGSCLSLTYDLGIYVTATEIITFEDTEKKESGQYQLNLLTTATIDLAKLTVIDGKIQPGSNAITQTATITIINKQFDLNLRAIDKKLHEEIQTIPNEIVAAVPTTPLADTLAKKNLLTPGFSSTDVASEASPKPAPPQSPKLKSE